MKNYMKEAAVLAVGLVIMGYMLFAGLDKFSQGARIVSVKGLAEMEVPADKVTWPLVFKDLSNDLFVLHNNISSKNEAIVAFLKSKGVAEDEISVDAPTIVDFDAERYYSSDQAKYRYNATSVITVTSTDVEKIRNLILKQSELLKQGIALASDEYSYRINYSFTGLNEIKPKMIEEATSNARLSAEKFAEDSNSKLGKIKRANQGQFSIYDRDNNTPYIKTVRVVTSVDYFLKN